MFPNSDQIALAIVTACRLTGEDPADVCAGRLGCKARHVAMDALRCAFPQARKVGLARCLGYSQPHNQGSNIIMARKAKWWREVWVDEVVGAMEARPCSHSC